MPSQNASYASSRDEIHWVKPNTPTLLGDLEKIPIPGTDLIFASLDGGWFLPGPIHLEGLKTALAAALHDYPHAAGRLRSDPETGKWYIALTNSAISITVHRSSVDPRPEVEFMCERNPEFLPWSYAPTSHNDEPLVRFKLTYWEVTNEFSFGPSWYHRLGDGLTFWRFMDNLTNCYVGAKPCFVPTFEKYMTDPPTLERSALTDTVRLVPHLAVDYSAEQFFAMYQNIMESTSRIDLQFSKNQLQKMRVFAEKSSGVKPIKWLMNVIDYRGVVAAEGSDYTPPPASSAGNITLTKYSDRIPDDAKFQIGPIASVIRNTIATSRDPDYVRRVVAISEELYTRSSNENRCQWWFPWDGGAAINNLYRVPWTGTHFGYPGKARFHVHDAWERYFRIWPGNPTQNEQGEWHANEGSARVFFRVKHHLKDKVLQIVQNDIRNMEFDDIMKAKK
ncbi:hypothetical protein PUNSTDRAFT_134145 [Punctularia strigosozonata HHB-11173 SS5]|uniref:uncharacterized protein n=1 Tax=Punctularia strigosozonata (strain HHB-11173) TaxID=741275 RepID=UPI0004418696|nr:uncharacterized protein PUNSTDRAFT_134145 [Punctularia strigosozonata HHB-11173 SS5]EIN08972.1 hypothetical protein PUNSTDRAFT_134145 [Punctularia strigosozonata HHB-11173 SS5]